MRAAGIRLGCDNNRRTMCVGRIRKCALSVCFVIERESMETVRFDELDLYPQVLRAIAEMGFEEATPIQSQAIPVVMSGVDVLGQAQTGTGKTASFGIPVLHKVNLNSKKTHYSVPDEGTRHSGGG